jgi:Tfp pilus assembly protein PilX
MSAHRQNCTPEPAHRPGAEQAAGVVLAFVIALLLVLAALHSLGGFFH